MILKINLDLTVFFIINVDIRASLRVPRLIFRTLKLTII